MDCSLRSFLSQLIDVCFVIILIVGICSGGVRNSHNECTKTTRQALNFCLAQCLSLVDPALLGQSRNKEDCVYNAKTGKMIRKTTSSCNECIQYDPNSAIANRTRGLNKLFKPLLKKICGKTFAYGSPLKFDAEYSGIQCGPAEPKYKIWAPDSTEEVKCIIENMDSEYQKNGKIRIQAYKSNCSNELILCDPKNPRPLPKSFLPVVKKVSENATEWCAGISYNMVGKSATNIELHVVSCQEQIAFMCEVIDTK